MICCCSLAGTRACENCNRKSEYVFKPNTVNIPYTEVDIGEKMMDALEEKLLEMGYIKAERCIPKPVILGSSRNTTNWKYYCHCSNCGLDIERVSINGLTQLIGKTYRQFCSRCGQLLEIPYKE